MAEVTSQNLYNQLTPIGQLYYDQQFKKQYTPGKENILLSSQPEYEKMKAVFESEQQVPEKSFLDSINIFGSASAAEPDKINTVSNTPGFETIVKPDGTIEIVPVGTSSESPFKSMQELAAENANLNLFPAPLNVSNFPANTFDDQVNFALKPQPLKNLGFDTSFGVANEADVEQEFLPDQKKSSGIADLFRTLIGFAVPGSSLLMGGFDGIRSLNQRLRNTDFGRSKNLMDFIDMKKYGGYQGREDARAATMAQARGAQKKIDRGDFGGSNISIDRGRGSIPSRSSPSPSKSRSSGGYGGGRDRGRGDRF